MCQRVRIQHICKRCKAHTWFANYSPLASKKTAHCPDYDGRKNKCRDAVERVTSGDRKADSLCLQCQNNPLSSKGIKEARRQLRRQSEASSGDDGWVDDDEERSPLRARRGSHRSSVSSGGWDRIRVDPRERYLPEYYDDDRVHNNTNRRIRMRGPQYDDFVRVEDYSSGLPSRPRRASRDEMADQHEYRGPPVPPPSSSQAQFRSSSSVRMESTPPISPRSSVQGSVISGKGGVEYGRADSRRSRSPTPKGQAARSQSRGPAQPLYVNPMPRMGRGPQRPPFPGPVTGAARM